MRKWTRSSIKKCKTRNKNVNRMISLQHYHLYMIPDPVSQPSLQCLRSKGNCWYERILLAWVTPAEGNIFVEWDYLPLLLQSMPSSAANSLQCVHPPSTPIVSKSSFMRLSRSMSCCQVGGSWVSGFWHKYSLTAFITAGMRSIAENVLMSSPWYSKATWVKFSKLQL